MISPKPWRLDKHDVSIIHDATGEVIARDYEFLHIDDFESLCTDGMDYKQLLEKYIRYVVDIEGAEFITDSSRSYMSHVKFGDAQWKELKRIANEAWKDY